MTDGYLTMAEIKAKCPDEWVLIDRPRGHPKTFETYGGWVVCHARDRDEFDELMLAAPHVEVGAIEYTGRPDPNVMFTFFA